MASSRRVGHKIFWCDSLIGLAVGRAAEKKYGAVHSAYDHAAADDRMKIEAVARACTDSPEGCSVYIAEIEREAAQFVDQHWSQILRVARALRASGRLDKAGIEAAILGSRLRTVDVSNDEDFFRRVDGYIGIGTAPPGARRWSAEPNVFWRHDGYTL
jgi:hypothetical protein